jgi:hypothetical protein
LTRTAWRTAGSPPPSTIAEAAALRDAAAASTGGAACGRGGMLGCGVGGGEPAVSGDRPFRTPEWRQSGEESLVVVLSRRPSSSAWPEVYLGWTKLGISGFCGCRDLWA